VAIYQYNLAIYGVTENSLLYLGNNLDSLSPADCSYSKITYK